MKCLFLGYGSKETSLIRFLKKKNISVKNIKRELKFKEAKKADIIISFGYRRIIKQSIIKAVNRPIINLHMSYLPYNRGAHPSFWSIIDDNPIGITIHEIDKGVDTGKIIFRKKFNINFKRKKFSTFKKIYNFLFKELEKLFKKNSYSIISNNYSTLRQTKKTKVHRKHDLPTIMKSWNQNIIIIKKLFTKKI